MSINVTFRHFKGEHPNLNQMAIEAGEKFKKFSNLIHSISVEFINDNENEKKVQFTVNLNGTTLVAEEVTDEFKKSIALAEDKMIAIIKKWKSKHSDH